MLKTLRSLLFPLKWTLSSSSEVGPHRDHNEDSIFTHHQNTLKIAIVCDGVGGNNAGEIASALCCQLLSEQLIQLPPSKLNKQALKQLIKNVHSQIVKHGNEAASTKGMATTLVAYIQKGNQHYIAWAGDSRAYLLRHQQLSQLTQDHSFVAEKVAQGIFTEEEAQNHHMASMITSSIGGSEKSLRHIGIANISPKKGDKIVLLSDGVYGFITPEQIKNSAQISAAATTQLAINENTSDNCSAIVITLQ
jgi:serine/threonine protein phosphatase PrpC